MNKDLIISATRHETKVAIVEDEQLVELCFQHANEYSLVGSIHKGRVTRVLPGMQSAFVDVGLERDAFLYVSDFFEDSEEYEPIAETKKQLRRGRTSRVREAATEAKAAAEPKERRGRRSRRRRGRGRDFPESKYSGAGDAEPTATTDATTSATTVAHEPERATQEDDDIFVLPGESVAKYEQSGESRKTEERSDSQASERLEEAKATAREQTSEEPAAPEPVVETVEEKATDDSEASEESKGKVESAEPRNAGHDSDAGTEPEDNESAESPDDNDSPEEKSEDSDIQEMIFGQIDKSIMEEIAALDRDEEHQGRLALDSSGDDQSTELKTNEEENGGPKEAAARVDEPEPRYHKRASRRGRRRQRNNSSEPGTKDEAPPAESPSDADSSRSKTVTRPEKSPMPLISDLLKEGQEILVQIAKEPLGQKGARITSHIALPGRYVVYMPTLDHMGVSRKIASDQERQRLREVLQKHKTGLPGGFIVRTAGEGQKDEDIAADMNFLFNLWTDIRKKAEQKPAPALLHHDLQVVERILRDQVTDEFRTIWVDNEETYESVLQFLHRFQPSLVKRVRLYTRSVPIFEAFNITTELEKALRPKVWLKSGGYIVINQTEALVAIDINTGKFVGRSNRLEDTIVKTNIEAIQEIVRQIRLRDLGGIIVVDFIDMDERKNRQRVMQALEEAMRQDRAPNKVLQFNDFGLVAITRKRVKQSLERALCSPCPYCEGAGYVKSVDTTIADIILEASKIAGAVEDEELILRVHPDVAKVLKSSDNEYLQELEETLGRPVMITADPLLHHEKFDLA